jgi:hypothetical protein
MYSSTPYDASSLAGSLLGLLFAGGVIYLLLWFAVCFIGAYISYRIIKAAVRNGMIEAINRTGLSGGVGSGGYVQGYPPAQSYGPPPAPITEQPGYRGPNG